MFIFTSITVTLRNGCIIQALLASSMSIKENPIDLINAAKSKTLLVTNMRLLERDGYLRRILKYLLLITYSIN